MGNDNPTPLLDTDGAKLFADDGHAAIGFNWSNSVNDTIELRRALSW